MLKKANERERERYVLVSLQSVGAGKGGEWRVNSPRGILLGH